MSITLQDKKYGEKCGECYDGGSIECYLVLRRDERGYYIYNHAWNYNAKCETYLGMKRLEPDFFQKYSIDEFIDLMQQWYPGYEVKRYVEANSGIQEIFRK